MKKQYKLTNTKEGYYLYPIPVDNNNKYLIYFKLQWEAEVFLSLLEHSLVSNPTISQDKYNYLKLHRDGKTKVYQVNFLNPMIELPERDLDLNKAIVIEKIIDKKLSDIINATDHEMVTKLDKFLQLNKKQNDCSQCKKLGIFTLNIKEFTSDLREKISTLTF